jgi:hypothetical protein
MIAFDLKCVNGHTFEGWFEDSRAYDEQKKKGLITCPVCSETMVSKIPSTFAIKGSQPSTSDRNSKPMELKNIDQEIIDYVDKNFDNVGSDFAKEALKIHYGVKEPRNIRGVSTEEEEKTLKKEGIQFFKIPKLPPIDS